MTALAAPVPTYVGSQAARRADERQGTVARAHLLAPTTDETRTGG